MRLRRFYAWACECLYAEWAGIYDWVSWLVSFGYWAQWQALALAYVQGARVLEIGFGTGEVLPRLATQGALPMGLELSPTMQQQTARKLARLGLALPRVQARAQAMPFADGAFETIIATFPAPYILEPATLQECARLLSCPTAVAGSRRLVIVGLWVTLEAKGWERLIPLFYRRPTPAALKRLALLFTTAGLRPVLLEKAVGFTQVGIVIAEPIGEAR